MSESESIVHVRDEARQVCRTGIVVDDFGVPAGSSRREYRIRVFMASRLQDVGTEDTEGNYRHLSDRLYVDSPEGTGRYLDSWHRVGSCGYHPRV